jgi:hypothetical protein
MNLSNRSATNFARIANATIHELVFANHHANSLAQCALNLDALQNLLAHAERRAAKHNHARARIASQSQPSGRSADFQSAVSQTSSLRSPSTSNQTEEA